MINKKRLLKLMQDLIRIDSQNPIADEYKIAHFVKDYLSHLGLEIGLHEFKKKRTNIIAQLKRSGNRKSLLITPHLDTVPAGKGWRFDPFSAAISKGRIYGVGATDCKVNLACAMEVVNSLVEDGVSLNYNLIFAATADEESGSGLGLVPLLDKGKLKADACVVLDADDFDIVVTQKGLMHIKVKISGKRAHGAYPWQGINAIDLALKIISAVKAASHKFIRNKYLRPPTINVGTIKGGDKVNVVADWCEFELDFRFLPGSSSAAILNQLKNIVSRYAKKSEIEIEGIQQPYFIDEKHPLVANLARSMKALKIAPRIRGSEGATVITFFQDEGIPAIATGFGHSGCAHSVNEYVPVKSLYKGAQVLEHFLKNYRFRDIKE